MLSEGLRCQFKCSCDFHFRDVASLLPENRDAPPDDQERATIVIEIDELFSLDEIRDIAIVVNSTGVISCSGPSWTPPRNQVEVQFLAINVNIKIAYKT